jgi:hypothetical protein
MRLKKLFILMCCLVISFAYAAFSATSYVLMTDTNGSYTYMSENIKMGLYEGSNVPSAEHFAAGMAIAKEMRNMDKINIVTIGHSVPWSIFNGWTWSSAVTQFKLNPKTNFKDGSGPAVMASNWVSTMKGTCNSLGGIAAADIHVLVVQVTWAPPMAPDQYQKSTKISEKCTHFRPDLLAIVQGARKNFKNLKMILMQSDCWENSHEPWHAYHEWIINRALVLDQIDGAADLDYSGASPKTAYMLMGGYIWEPNASRSYYSDEVHCNATGAAYYREKWVKSLLAINPIVSYWLAAANPTEVENYGKPLTLAPTFKTMSGNRGIEVEFALPYSSQIGLSLLSANGQAVVPMFEKTYEKGQNSVMLKSASALTPGAYIVRLSNGSMTQSHMTTIAK